MAQILKISASSGNFSKRVQQGRDKFEKPRQVTKKRLQDDVSKIVSDEVQFSKSLLKQMIPLEISIDKKATGLKKFIPLNFEFITDDDKVASVEPYVNDSSDAILVDEKP
jgi:hypothetical protein